MSTKQRRKPYMPDSDSGKALEAAGVALDGMAQGVMRIDEDRPLLEGDASKNSGVDGMFAAIGQLEAATVRMLDAA